MWRPGAIGPAGPTLNPGLGPGFEANLGDGPGFEADLGDFCNLNFCGVDFCADGGDFTAGDLSIF